MIVRFGFRYLGDERITVRPGNGTTTPDYPTVAADAASRSFTRPEPARAIGSARHPARAGENPASRRTGLSKSSSPRPVTPSALDYTTACRARLSRWIWRNSTGSGDERRLDLGNDA